MTIEEITKTVDGLISVMAGLDSIRRRQRRKMIDLLLIQTERLTEKIGEC